MKPIAYLLAGFLGLVGLSAVVAAGYSNFTPRLVAGLVCFAASAVVFLLARFQPVEHTHVHKMELDVTGDVSLEQMQCQQCGAELSAESIDMSEGALFVKCEYCGSQYQIEEEAKW